MLTNGNAFALRSILRSVNHRLLRQSVWNTCGVSENCGRSSVIARTTRNYLVLGRPFNDRPTWPSDRGSLYQPECRLRQRARSCETPSNSRPRVGPPRSPSSPSAAPRSRIVPVSRAAELLSRPTCRTRRENPITPQAASVPGRLQVQFECYGNREAAAI